MNIEESRHWRGSGLKEVVDLWLWNPTSLRVLVENPEVVVLRNKNGTDWDVSSDDNKLDVFAPTRIWMPLRINLERLNSTME